MKWQLWTGRPATYSVELEACNDEDLDYQCGAYDIAFELVAEGRGHGFPVYRYTGPLANLRAFLADAYDDGSGDDIGDNVGLPKLAEVTP